MLALSPTQLFTGDRIVEDVTVKIDGGRIVDVAAGVAHDAVKLDGLLAPGLIDVQVNGGGGVLFNDAPTIEMPTYLKLLELGTIGAGVLRRLWQQSR